MGKIIGIFPTKETADSALLCLLSKGYKVEDISMVIKEDLVLNKEKGQKGGIASSSLKSGILSGRLIDDTASILFGLSAIFVPGLGAVLIAGPIASMLGIGTAATVTISGVATGVLAGGLAAGLAKIGIDKNVANFFEKKVKDGGVLMYVPITDESNSNIRQIFIENSGNFIKEIDGEKE